MDKQEIIEYCLTLPEVYEDDAFGGSWTAIRHSITRKGFAFIYKRDDKLCVNLRCPPLKADFLRQLYKDVSSGYRMNKGYWNAVTVCGDVPEQELRDMIDESYELAKPKPPKITSKQAKPKAIQIRWPENLYRAVLGDEYTAMPDNAEESAMYALSKLRAREQNMILARFRDNKKYAAIGAEYGISKTRVSQINDHSIRKLRNPKRSRYFTHLSQALASDRFADATTPEERRNILTKRYGEQHVCDLESLSIEELRLSNRAHNRLLLSGVNTLADLAMLTLPELLNLRLLGREAYDEIMAACEKYGIRIMDGSELYE